MTLRIILTPFPFPPTPRCIAHTACPCALQINTAYSVLMDPGQRRRYDLTLSDY
jgi:hypothetical protein